MDPTSNLSALDQAIFKIKMDIMMVKSEVVQLKDELVNYFDSILNLHLNHFKNKVAQRNEQQSNEDCELGLGKLSEEDVSEETYDDEESSDDEEESINEDDLIFNKDDVFKNESDDEVTKNLEA